MYNIIIPYILEDYTVINQIQLVHINLLQKLLNPSTPLALELNNVVSEPSKTPWTMATPSLFLASKLKAESLANAKLKSLAISYAFLAGTPYIVRKSMLPSVGVQRESS